MWLKLVFWKYNAVYFGFTQGYMIYMAYRINAVHDACQKSTNQSNTQLHKQLIRDI